MTAPVHFLADLLMVLGVAAAVTLVFQKLRQPVVLGYVLAGIIIGPHVPIPLVADVQLVSTLSELGVILLMFSIGLEFSLPRIARIGVPAGLTAVFEVGLMVSLGYLLGHAFGWSARESLFLGACLGISSTMLVAKAFEERGLSGGFTEVVFAVLVFEDLIAILLLAVLTALASGAGLSAGAFAILAGRLAAFLAAMLVVGLLLVPRAIRAIVRLERRETLLIASMAICFGMAFLAERLGYSVALGAFLGGTLVAESGEGGRVERLIGPFRDVFAAIFFVSVGMTVDPRQAASQWLPILVLSAVVIAGKATGVTVGSFLTGSGLRPAVRAGLSMGQIGEFSFIIAGLGLTTGATRDTLLPIAVAVSCLTALTTPWLILASDRAASLLDARLPRRLQTFVGFYAAWIDALRAAPPRSNRGSRTRRTVGLLVVDALCLGAIVIGVSLGIGRLTGLVGRWMGVGPGAARAIVLAAAGLGAGLFLVGVLRCAHRLATILAAQVVPPGAADVPDLGRAPRRALVVALELAIILVVGLPFIGALAPFVPSGLLWLGGLVVAIAAALWRSSANLHGHVRAGSELVLETLARSRRDPEAAAGGGLEEVRERLPGLPPLASVRVEEGSAAAGKTLGELNVRALTGATVLAIHRRETSAGAAGSVLPAAGEILRAGDLLALAGSEDAIEAARRLLGAPPAVPA